METSELVKKCQFCAENILIDAHVCKFCNRNQIDDKKTEEIIKSLSINKSLVGYIFFFVITFSIKWWLGLISIALINMAIGNERQELSKVSKLELLEKYEKYQKYLRGQIYLDIIFYIVIIVLMLMIIGYYSQTGAI